MNKNPNHEFDHTNNENRLDKENKAKDPDWDRGLLDEFEPFGKREKGKTDEKAVKEEPKNTDPHGLLDEFEPFGKKEKVFSDEERDREIAQENYTPDASIEEKVDEAREKAEENDIGDERHIRKDQDEEYNDNVNLPGSDSGREEKEIDYRDEKEGRDLGSPAKGQSHGKTYREIYQKDETLTKEDSIEIEKARAAGRPLESDFEDKYEGDYDPDDERNKKSFDPKDNPEVIAAPYVEGVDKRRDGNYTKGDIDMGEDYKRKDRDENAAASPAGDFEEKYEKNYVKEDSSEKTTNKTHAEIKNKRNDQNEGYEEDVNLPGSQSHSRKADKEKNEQNELGENFEEKYEKNYVKEDTPQGNNKKEPAEENFEEKYREKYADKNTEENNANAHYEKDHPENKGINTAIPNAGFEEEYREKYVKDDSTSTDEDLYTDPEAKDDIKDRGELREENVVEEALRETKARQREGEKGQFLKEELERLELEEKQYDNNIYIRKMNRF